MKKILITGSCGFILSNFIRRSFFLKQPYQITSVDYVENSDLTRNLYTNKLHKFYLGNVCDEHFLDIIFKHEKPDIVIHGASSMSSIETDTKGTESLIKACKNNGVSKFLYLSKDSVYGSAGLGKPFTEEAPLNPSTVYSAQKSAGELLTKAFSSNDLNYNILRLCNNFGPRQPSTYLIPNIIKNVINDEADLYLNGKGDQVRTWMHVYDTYNAIYKIIESGEDNTIYNVSNEFEFTNLEVLNMVCNFLKKPIKKIVYKDNVIESFRLASSGNKLRELGWKPEFKFRDSLEETVNWYNINRWSL